MPVFRYQAASAAAASGISGLTSGESTLPTPMAAPKPPRHEHLGQVRPRSFRHIGGLAVLLNVFFVDHDPGDLVEVDAVFRGENTPRPDTGGNGVRAHANLLALEILGRLHTGLYVVDDGRVVKLAHDEDRQGRARCG